jgi:fused signal recognition particle receptor
MFRSLKDKLKRFRKKAIKELQAEDDSPGKTSGGTLGSKVAVSDQKTVRDDKAKVKPDERKKHEPLKPQKKPQRKRSRQPQATSLKRVIETETADETPWVESEKKAILEEQDEGWFTKAIPENKLDSILDELEVVLLESDVALPVIDEIKKLVKKEIVGKKIKRGLDLDTLIETALRNAVFNVLTSEIINFDEFIQTHEKPIKLMFVGVNGTGKTSAIAKLAFRLKKQKKSCVIAAGDTFRAGAIEQLEQHANKLGIKLIKDKVGSDPAAIAYDSIEHAKARHKDIVMIDTAGRMQTNINLMDEMRKIKRVAKPDLIIFVGDALAGNDVVEQAIQFENVVGIDGAILTKLDADAKGGAALSIAYAVGKPILFVSVGQRYGDLVPFNTEWMVKRLFD